MEAETLSERAGRLLAVVSGRGGAGKTTLALNLAIALADLERRVLLVDADMGLASPGSLLGLSPRLDAGELIERGAGLDSALLATAEGISVLDSSGGLDWLPAPAAAELLAELRRRFDQIVLDTPAALGVRVVDALAPVDAVLLVLTPDPTAVTDGFTLIKALGRAGFAGSIGVAVNMGESETASEELFRRFARASGRFAVTKLEYLGQIGQDRSVTDAAVHERPVLRHAPQGLASRCLRELAGRLLPGAPAAPAPAPELEALVPGGLQLDALPEPEFRGLLCSLEQAYQRRFGRPWREPAGAELAALAAELARQGSQLAALRESYEQLARALAAVTPPRHGA